MASLLETLKAEKAKAERGNQRTESIKPGKHKYRILPNKSGNPNDPFHHDFGRHFIKTPEGKKMPFVCGAVTFNGSCQVCDQIHSVIATSRNPTLKAEAGEAKASNKVIVNALHLSGDTPNKPVVVELPKTVWTQFLNFYIEYMEDDGTDITNLDNGYDIVVERSGSGREGTNYSVMLARKSTSIDKSVMSEVTDLAAFCAAEDAASTTKALSYLGAAGVAALPSAGGDEPEVSRPSALPSSSAPVTVESADDMPFDDGDVFKDDVPAAPAPEAKAPVVVEAEPESAAATEAEALGMSLDDIDDLLN